MHLLFIYRFVVAGSDLEVTPGKLLQFVLCCRIYKKQRTASHVRGIETDVVTGQFAGNYYPYLL